jgi:hypothetical protein
MGGFFRKLSGGSNATGGAAADGSAASSGYDRIGVPSDNGDMRYLTRQQFEALALQERVSLLMKGKMQFFRDGRPISAREALRGA